MADLWNPAAERNEAPRSLWGPVQDPEVGVLHTTESRGQFRPQAGRYFGKAPGSYPNATISRGTIYEHIPANRSSRALKNLPGGVETNKRGTYQIEIDWNSADVANCPADTMAAVRAQMAWVSSVTSIPLTCSVTFHPYPVTTPGVRYGSEPWRLSFDAWRRYRGWLGHQHAPENSHGDPGGIDIAYLLGGATTAPDTPEQEWDEMATEQQIRDIVAEEAALAVMAITGDEFAPGEIRDADVFNLRDLSAEVRAGVLAVGVQVIQHVATQQGVTVDPAKVATAVSDELARRLGA